MGVVLCTSCRGLVLCCPHAPRAPSLACSSRGHRSYSRSSCCSRPPSWLQSHKTRVCLHSVFQNKFSLWKSSEVYSTRKERGVIRSWSSGYDLRELVPSVMGSVVLLFQEADLDTELANCHHYMQFAAAAYGWPLYVYRNPFTGLCKIGGDWWVGAPGPAVMLLGAPPSPRCTF